MSDSIIQWRSKGSPLIGKWLSCHGSWNASSCSLGLVAMNCQVLLTCQPAAVGAPLAGILPPPLLNQPPAGSLPACVARFLVFNTIPYLSPPFLHLSSFLLSPSHTLTHSALGLGLHTTVLPTTVTLYKTVRHSILTTSLIPTLPTYLT